MALEPQTQTYRDIWWHLPLNAGLEVPFNLAYTRSFHLVFENKSPRVIKVLCIKLSYLITVAQMYFISLYISGPVIANKLERVVVSQSSHIYFLYMKK